MSDAPREAAVLRSLTARLTGRGFVVYKQHGGPLTGGGRPDLLVTLGARHCWVETKTRRGRVSMLQAATFRRMQECGDAVFVGSDVDRLEEAVVNFLRDWMTYDECLASRFPAVLTSATPAMREHDAGDGAAGGKGGRG